MQRTTSELPYNPAQALTSCIDAFGPGQEGWRCGSCANLQAISVEGATIYYCCIDGAARQVTSAACSRFEEAPLAREIPPPAGVPQSGRPDRVGTPPAPSADPTK
jgi:hypothetical protein